MEKKVIMMMGIMKEDTVAVEVIAKVMMKKDQTNITDQVNAFQDNYQPTLDTKIKD